MGKIKFIKLTKGKYTKVDAKNFDFLNQWKWQYGVVGYAYRSLNKRTKVYMHRFIHLTPEGFITDHINGDKLDNREENLRTVSGMENGRNRDKPKHNTSGFKGVCWDKSKNKWMAYLRKGYKHIFLGRFKDLENAVKARIAGERRYWI